MNCGKAWIVTESYYNSGEEKLLTILYPRMSHVQVKKYIEQRYVDTHASILEKIAYKKSPDNSPYRTGPVDNMYPYVLHCGHDPHYVAVYCHKVLLTNEKLHYYYNRYEGTDEDHRPIFTEIEGVVTVNGV